MVMKTVKLEHNNNDGWRAIIYGDTPGSVFTIRLAKSVEIKTPSYTDEDYIICHPKEIIWEGNNLILKSDKNLSRMRHLLKTISWRLIGTIDTIIVGTLISGDYKLGLSIGGIEILTKMILYYIHERVWYKLPFGGNR